MSLPVGTKRSSQGSAVIDLFARVMENDPR